MRGSSEYIYDEIEPVNVGDVDAEYTDVGTEEEELPDFGGGDQSGGEDDVARREKELDESRKESVESFELAFPD